jgi:hypothetical protein
MQGDQRRGQGNVDVDGEGGHTCLEMEIGRGRGVVRVVRC